MAAILEWLDTAGFKITNSQGGEYEGFGNGFLQLAPGPWIGCPKADSEVNCGPVEQLLDGAIERTSLKKLEVKVSRTLENWL